jgi:hypothetical protein
VRTRPGICQRKARYETEEAAIAVAARASVPLRPYRCGLCRKYHLTSRTRGMRLPRFEIERRQAEKGSARKPAKT